MSAPKTYKAAQVKEKGGKLELVDIEYKAPGPGQIVVKVLASGVCHSDSVVVEQHMPTGLPRVPGHEIVGDVFAVGEGEGRWKVGDRVGSGWHGGHDLTCASCLKGDFVTCKNENINGVFTDGGHAEYVTLRTEAVCSIPTDIKPEQAAPLLTTFNSLRNMDVHPGDVVAIQGIGGLGHLGVQFARKMGYKTVALSGSDSKRALAAELGAHEYIDGSKEDQGEALQKMGGAKVVLCTAPNPKVINTLVNGLAVNGTLLVLAVADKIDVPIVPLIMKRLSVRGWPSGRPADSEDTVKFAQTAGVEVRTETYPLEKIQDAYDSMMNGKARFRSVIVF
ncbi:hypothetical protein JCM10207_003273 [Rhodosporidiobolus poonsookiae]